MKKLEYLLSEWVKNDLISIEQATKISEFESKSPKSNNWALNSLIILGVSILAIGLISITAANWEVIPNTIKLGSNFLLLSILGFFTINQENKGNTQVAQTIMIFLSLCTLGSIGLISQIYHTGGQYYQALLLWNIINIGLFLLAKNHFLPIIWWSLLITALLLLFENHNIKNFFNNNHLTYLLTVFSILYTSTLLLIQTKKIELQTKAGFYVIAIFSLSILGIGEFADLTISKNTLSITWNNYLALLFAMIPILVIWFLKTLEKSTKFILSATQILMIFCYLITFVDNRSPYLYPFFNILTITSFALYLASQKYRKLFQTFLIIIGVRFFVIYLQAFSGLMMTGVGLIITGMLIIGISYFWYKHRLNILSFAESLVKNEKL